MIILLQIIVYYYTRCQSDSDEKNCSVDNHHRPDSLRFHFCPLYCCLRIRLCCNCCPLDNCLSAAEKRYHSDSFPDNCCHPIAAAPYYNQTVHFHNGSTVVAAESLPDYQTADTDSRPTDYTAVCYLNPFDLKI